MNQQRMHVRSTQLKQEEYCENEAKRAVDLGSKTHYVYAATVDAGQIYTDQTSYFPVMSSKGNTYMMVLYDYDENSTMAEHIKNRRAAELLCAFQVIEQKIIPRGLKPRLIKLENEASQLLKNYLYDKNISFQLVPPYWHCCNTSERDCCNTAERAIRSFTEHLIAGLCSAEKRFPMHLWDRVLPQTIIIQS
jgi:hypothetical protein